MTDLTAALEAAWSRKMKYLRSMPKYVPAGKVVVHNHVRPQRGLGMDGFRAWLQSPDPARLVECDCKWAPELSQHFRVRPLA